MQKPGLTHHRSKLVVEGFHRDRAVVTKWPVRVLEGWEQELGPQLSPRLRAKSFCRAGNTRASLVDYAGVFLTKEKRSLNCR